MSTNTTNYELVKPALTDASDITAMNGNWDTIDTELKRVYDKAFEAQTGNRALVSSASGAITTSDVTSTELGYLSGVTSAVQTQLDGKQASISGAASSIASSNLTSNRALVSNGSGKVAASNVTSTELGYLSGADGNIQDQIDTVFEESKEMVGDIIQTSGDIQDGWVEANGGIIDKTEHPDLYRISPYSGYVQQRTVTVSTSSARRAVQFFKKLNGYYVGMSYGTLFWRTPGSSTYTKRDLATTLIEGRYSLGPTDIMWDEANSQWLLAAHVQSTSGGSTGYVKLYSMPTLNGTLTKVFEYTNTGSGDTPVLLKKIDSYYFYKDASYDNASASNNKQKMNYTTNPNGTWNVIAGSSFGMNYSVNFVGKFNGRWIVGGAKTVTEDAKVYPAIAISGLNQDFLTATWTVKMMGGGIGTNQTPARFYFVNNVVYMPNCGAYLFATGEQGDNDAETFYSYDLNTFTNTSETNKKRIIGGEGYYGPQVIDGILYAESGAYRDTTGTTGNPLLRRFEGNTGTYTSTAVIKYPKVLCDDMYLTNSGTTTAVENICTKSLPTITGDYGMTYKIKADGVSGTGG